MVNYTKPAILVVLPATQVISGIDKPISIWIEIFSPPLLRFQTVGAYQADE